MKEKSAKEAHESAVKNVQNILKTNRMKSLVDENKNVVINGKTYIVTTNTKENSAHAHHFITMRQMKDMLESGADGVIVYHTGSNAMVMFNTLEQFQKEIEKDIRWKHYEKEETDSDGLVTVKKTNVPYYLPNFKSLCQNYGFLTTPSDFSKVDELINNPRSRRSWTFSRR